MLLQIVGLKGGLHTGVALSNISNHIHGERLAQAREVEILFEMQTRTSPCLVLRHSQIVLCCTMFILSCLVLHNLHIVLCCIIFILSCVAQSSCCPVLHNLHVVLLVQYSYCLLSSSVCVLCATVWVSATVFTGALVSCLLHRGLLSFALRLNYAAFILVSHIQTPQLLALWRGNRTLRLSVCCCALSS